MTVQLEIQNKTTGIIYDISELIESLTWEVSLEAQPSKLEFTFKKDAKVPNANGSAVRFRYNGVGIFFGSFFRYKKNEGEKLVGVCYDQSRYLAFSDTIARLKRTASGFFADVCKNRGLNYRVAKSSPHTLSDKLFDSKSLYTMFSESIDETLAFNNDWYLIYDDFGVLTFDHIDNLKTKTVIGDESLLTGYEFEASIDDDTFNQVKLIKEDKEKKKRNVYIVKDSNSIKNWGLLQYFKTITEDLNDAQIRRMAEQMLTAKNREIKSLSLTSLGRTGIRAGSGIILSITDLIEDGVPYDSYAMVTAATHTFSESSHMMKLEVLVR